MIFIDASFFIAASIRKDQWHQRLQDILPEVTKQDKVTSIFVLSEAVTMVGSLAGGKKGTLLYNYIMDNHEVKFVDKELSSRAMNIFLQIMGCFLGRFSSLNARDNPIDHCIFHLTPHIGRHITI